MKEVSSLYIHFPFCRHLCNYCDFYKHKLESKSDIEKYEIYLNDQIGKSSVFLKKYGYELGDLETVYMGGGTPSLWGENGSKFFKQFFSIRPNAEFTLEVDPGTWTEKEFESWVNVGVNRISVGIQTFDEHYLKIMDREHSMDDAKELLNFLKNKKMNYSVDLMLGLPSISSNKRDVLKEIDLLIDYNPSHFSVYILKTRANYLLNNKLPGEDDVSDEYLKVCNYLNENGYIQYEVSNFAKNSAQSRHNKKYWNYESVAALGANATGLLTFDNSALRYQWKPSGDGQTTERLEGSSLKIEQIYMMLRVNNGLKDDYFKGENLVKFQSLKSQWSKRGYIKSEVGGISLTPAGFLIIDSLMDDIFRDLTI